MADKTGHTKKTTDFWGHEKEEHFDEHGNKTGETKFTTDWLGRPKQEHYNADHEKTGETRKGSDWLGRDRAEHFDNQNQRVGHSRDEEDSFGRPVQRHYDSSGNKVGQTYPGRDWLGRARKEHEGQHFKSGNAPEEPNYHSSSGDYGSSSGNGLAAADSSLVTAGRSSKAWVGVLTALALAAMIFIARNKTAQKEPERSQETLDSAKTALPGILSRIYELLNQGNPTAARSMLSPQLSANMQKLDFICRPFAYRKHYIEGIIERPGPQFQARVHVLFQPMEERVYVLDFGVSQHQFVLSDVTDAGEDWMGPGKEAALDLARKFAYAAKANRKDVLTKIVTPSLDLSTLFADEEYQSRLREMGELRYEQVDLRSYYGLKFRVHFYSTRGICSDTWDFLVDRVQGQYKIVKWEFTPIMGCYSLFKSYNATEDPNLASYTLARFGLSPAE